MNRALWFLLAASALLGSSAYVFPILSIIFLPLAIIMVWYAQYQLINFSPSYASTILQSACAGFWWGALFFGTHFIWLLILLITHAHATLLLSIFLFLLLATYFALTSSIWFCISIIGAQLGERIVPKLIASMLSFGITIYGYWWFLGNYSLWFCARKEGYPLLSPFIPLAFYKYVLLLMGYVGNFFHGGMCVTKQSVIQLSQATTTCFNNQNITWCTLTPLKRSTQYSMQEYGDAIKTQLHALDLKNNNQLTLIIGPESTVSIPLNEHPDIIKQWGNELSTTSHLLIGAYRRTQSEARNKTKWYQTVYWIHDGVIVDWYDKTHCVPFNEKMPAIFKNISCLSDLFLKNHEHISVGKDKKGAAWQLTERCALVPKICSELFNTSVQFSPQAIGNKSFVVWFVNDSWFVPYVGQLLGLYATWWTAWHQVPLLYISHTQAFLIANS